VDQNDLMRVIGQENPGMGIREKRSLGKCSERGVGYCDGMKVMV